MSDHSTLLARPPARLDYSLTGVSAARAIENGLAEADWYQCPVPRATLRRLLERRNGPAIRDTILWFGLLFVTAGATWAHWGTWWAVLPYLAYSVLYSQTSDSRWHESGHGTAFKTDWMNNALYEIASFMVKREATVWRWSHTRHHSDTIIVGRDPEISIPRPPNWTNFFLGFFCLHPDYWKKLVLHARGRMSSDERTFIPADQFGAVSRRARLYLLIYAAAFGAAVLLRSSLPIFLVVLPNVFGTWLLYVYNMTQHAGLAENVLDHRLNCRTVLMNPVNRFLYWNMNYHLEHHMFPLVPYHALPRLHELVKPDTPPAYRGLFEAWSEIIPALVRQRQDPGYYVKRRLPDPKLPPKPGFHAGAAAPDDQGWIEVCAAADLGPADLLRFDLGQRTFALIRDEEGRLFATEGYCTHGHTHLSEGLVKGRIVECPKHNGRFNLKDGSPARAPACRALATYALEERLGRLYLNVRRSGGEPPTSSLRFRVVSNRNVATFIKELVLEPLEAKAARAVTPGDYLQFAIPAYDEIRFAGFDVPEPYAAVWRRHQLFDLVARNPNGSRRNNYSLASNPVTEKHWRFNVRIATPPPGQDCPPGAGSSYLFSRRPGDTVEAIGPFGDFHVRPTQREMVFIGGGAGMAPLRAHLAHLFENEGTARRVSFWYGARSRQELFYRDYFEALARKHPNFTFHVALSAAMPEDEWTGLTGFIHEVVLDRHLAGHPNPKAVEYYLCGPPQMIRACTRMLHELGVASEQISHDEF